MIYLDSAATSQIDKRVLDAMMPYLENQYGNPGSIHILGRASKAAIDKAREQVANLIGCAPEQVVFTSGGSESNSTVFSGVKDYLLSSGKKHILVSAVEHDSVIKAAQGLIKDGFYVEFVPVSCDGVVSVADIERRLRPDTGLVSVMYVNNETGSVNPVEEIGALCLKRGILFHTDCVQAAPCCEIDVGKIGCDFLSISSHKIHGPKGVGALFIKEQGVLSPLAYGGAEQEHGMRGGTENVAGIVGFGEACEILVSQLSADIVMTSVLKQKFYEVLQDSLHNQFDIGNIVSVNGMSVIHPGKILNIEIDNVDGETLLLMLDGQEVCMSAGSACRSHEKEPSHVLTAMGLSAEEARSSIRVSFSRMNDVDEVSRAANMLANDIATLRAAGGFDDSK